MINKTLMKERYVQFLGFNVYENDQIVKLFGNERICTEVLKKYLIYKKNQYFLIDFIYKHLKTGT